MNNETCPKITISLAIDTLKFSDGSSPQISVSATSHAARPITIFTWPTVFNLRLAQKRGNFTCIDLTTEKSIHMKLTKGGKRPEFSRELGGRDDVYFLTLEPEKPCLVSGTLKIAHATESRRALVPGHRYRFGIREDEAITWWRFGTKEEVMAPSGQATGLGEASGPPIALPAKPVELDVEGIVLAE